MPDEFCDGVDGLGEHVCGNTAGEQDLLQLVQHAALAAGQLTRGGDLVKDV